MGKLQIALSQVIAPTVAAVLFFILGVFVGGALPKNINGYNLIPASDVLKARLYTSAVWPAIERNKYVVWFNDEQDRDCFCLFGRKQ